VIWDQRYLLFGHGLGFSAVIAATPIFVLMILLGVLRKPAWIAGLAGLGVTFVLAVAGYRMPVVTAVSAAADGAAFGLFPISWIVFWAIALYRVTVETGKFSIIKDSTGRLTSDPRLQGILIAFAFGAFIEGAAGFGTPVAIAAAMLTGLGFSAYRASSICLLANSAPGAFGAIGIPVITLAGITGLPLDKLSAATGRLCTPLSFITPAYLVVAMGGFGALSGVWLPVLLIGAVFAGTQFCVSSFIGPQLTDILASLASMVALVVLLRFWQPKERDSAAIRRVALGAESAVAAQTVGSAAQVAKGVHAGELVLDDPADNIPGQQGAPVEHTLAQVLYAWLPYALLVACVLLWGVKPFQVMLDKASMLTPWPYLHNMIRRMPPIVKAPSLYPALFNLNWFSAAGTACMVATFLSAISLKMSFSRFVRLLWSVVHQLILPTVTVTSVLALAFLMNYSGATATLGLVFAATGAMFPFFGVCLGWLGVFLTGSDTSANALFGGLQMITAARLGFSPILMASANAAGGVVGKMISLQSIAVAAAATGMSVADQARLFRFTLKHSIVLTTLLGGVALFYAYVLHLN
jgi:L-lactate permease